MGELSWTWFGLWCCSYSSARWSGVLTRSGAPPHSPSCAAAVGARTLPDPKHPKSKRPFRPSGPVRRAPPPHRPCSQAERDRLRTRRYAGVAAQPPQRPPPVPQTRALPHCRPPPNARQLRPRPPLHGRRPSSDPTASAPSAIFPFRADRTKARGFPLARLDLSLERRHARLP